MKQIFNLFIIEEKPYLTIDEDVKIGDTVIVTVGGMYPSVIECQNDEQIRLFQKPKTSLTKRHKVVVKPTQINLDKDIIDNLKEKDSYTSVEFENGEITFINEEAGI
jgi:hypothetical protein